MYQAPLKGAAAWAATTTHQTLLNKQFATADFHPGEKFRDTNGELIQAHGGGMLYHEGVFYWYGENKDGPTYTAFSLRCLLKRPSALCPHDYNRALPCHDWPWYLTALFANSHSYRNLFHAGCLPKLCPRVSCMPLLRAVKQHRPLTKWNNKTFCARSGSPARVDVIGVSCYSSRDLVTWRNEGASINWGARRGCRDRYLSQAMHRLRRRLHAHFINPRRDEAYIALHGPGGVLPVHACAGV